MAIPEQIRKQTEAVQELYKQLNADDETGATSADEQNSYEEPSNNRDEQYLEQADEYNAESVNPPPSDGHKQGGKKKKTEETLAQKYRTLQGMYNAEVPRLHQQNKDLQGRIQQLEQLLATMTEAPANRQAQQAPTTVDRLVTDRDVEEYGESIDVMRKVSREEYIPVAQKIAQMEQMLQRMQTQVVPQVNHLTQRQAQSAEQQFWAQLSMAVPVWREVNDNPDFQTWLLQADPLTGISRQTVLEDAQRNLDVERVARFFGTWMEQSGYADIAQNSRQVSSTSQLEKQVAPGRSRNMGAPTGGAGKTYSPDDIRSFFESVRMGKYKGREAERDRIERDIFSAQREGRIIVNA
jgi:hypothetical protein